MLMSSGFEDGFNNDKLGDFAQQIFRAAGKQSQAFFCIHPS
jgi:hypothetical protein